MRNSPLIAGFGFAVPSRSLSNAAFVDGSDITEEWILSRTGIAARRVLQEGTTCTDLALTASVDALAAANRSAEDITHIIYATCTPDTCCPSAACTLAAKLSLKGRMAVDVNAACTGFITALELAAALVTRTPQACVLLVAAEALSHRCNHKDHATAVLFGDGAGAVLITGANAPLPQNNEHEGGLSASLADVLLGSDGSKGDLLLITGGFSASPYALGDTVGSDYFIRMQGGPVFKHAVRNMTACCQTLLARNNLETVDVDIFVPHQANLRIIEAVGSRLGIPSEKVFLNVQKYGNTSAASIPLALGEAVQTGCISPGTRVLVTSFGGGLTWGAALLCF